MIDPEQFDGLVAQVAVLNQLDPPTADAVVAAVGDFQKIDTATGKIIATLPDGRELLVQWPDDEG